MNIRHRVTYTASDIAAKERELVEWEQRLEVARENVLNATSRNYRTTVISWDNIKDVTSHLRCQLRAMRKAMGS